MSPYGKSDINNERIKREYILKQIIEGKLSGIEGARRLDISIRQMRRIIQVIARWVC